MDEGVGFGQYKVWRFTYNEMLKKGKKGIKCTQYILEKKEHIHNIQQFKRKKKVAGG